MTLGSNSDKACRGVEAPAFQKAAGKAVESCQGSQKLSKLSKLSKQYLGDEGREVEHELVSRKERVKRVVRLQDLADLLLQHLSVARIHSCVRACVRE